MHDLPPHRTLMLLHKIVDRAITPLLAPLGLEHATEGYVTVMRDDLDQLAAHQGDPQSVLLSFGPRATANGVMIAEPALTSAMLSRIWRADRDEHAPLTQVEGEILRQFLARLVAAWADGWAAEGVKMLPELALAGSLSLLQPQMASGRWHIARTVVRERGESEPLGVLLFGYPTQLLPQFGNEARSTLWRSRLDRGLTAPEQARLAQRLAGPLRDLTITAPVVVRQDMTLGMLNALERGDIVAFDETGAGDITFAVLGRTVTGRLAAHNTHLAIAFTDGASAPTHAPDDAPVSGGGGAAPLHMHDEPLHDEWGDPASHPPEPDDFTLAS